MRFHFVGIGGIGMGTLASLMLDKGHLVSGSDLKESPLSASLKEKGARIFIGHHADQVGLADYVVYSSAIPADNPEILLAQQKRIPLLKRAELLAQIMDHHRGVTVAGAHGKTTTTSMISHLLIEAGLNPSTAVGGIINNTGLSYNANLGGGTYFVAEVDESDGSFLYFSPEFSIITNIDFEHVDYYHNWDNILKAYEEFISKTKPQGMIIGCGDDPRLRKILELRKRPFYTYGFSRDNDVFPTRMNFINANGCYWEFECQAFGKPLGVFQLSIPGQHNILNAMAAITLGLQLQIPSERMAEFLKGFSGVKRRFQLKGIAAGVRVVDDYGHHPTEIEVTLKTALSVKDQRVVVIFQPHRYSRTQFLMNEFVAALQAADLLILTDIYPASEPPIPGVTSQVLLEKIIQAGKTNAVCLPKGEILNYLLSCVRSGDLVLTLGAGDIYRVGEELLGYLAKKGVVPPVGTSL